MLPNDGRRQWADHITHNHSIIPFLEFLRSGSILEHQFFWKQWMEKVTADFLTHLKAALLNQAWGKQNYPRGHALQKSCSRGRIKVCLTQCTATRHRDPIFQPCLLGISVGQINILPSSQICPQCEEKRSAWSCSASWQKGEELLSWLCWTICWWFIITLLNVWSSLLNTSLIS